MARRKHHTRGMTLIEILVVVGLIALIAGAVAVAVVPRWIHGQERMAETNARTIRGAVKTWWVEHDASTCPELEQLVSDGVLDKDSPHMDPWKNPWKITCADQDVTISSAGPDRMSGTGDDIRVPPT
jgi:general secretion pathway protein G